MPVMTTPSCPSPRSGPPSTREMPGVRADLERLVRIPGIAFDGFDHSHVERSAEAVAELLRGCGLPTSGSCAPAASRRSSAAGRPRPARRRCCSTPTTTCSRSATCRVGVDPFEPIERDGRLYGRGAADDKAGIMAHVAALRAFGDDAAGRRGGLRRGRGGVRLRLAGAAAREHRDELAADVIVIADSANWDIGVAGADHLAARHRQLLRRGAHARPRRAQRHVRRRRCRTR